MFFYLATVSKSLLIVIGTLPLPAKIDREKYRLAGIKSGPARLGQARKHGLSILFAVRVGQGRLACGGARFCLSPHSAGGAAAPAPPAYPVPAGWFGSAVFSAPSDCTVRRFALVKAHGVVRLPAVRKRHKPNRVLPAQTVSLDNSCPPNSFFLGAEKTHSGAMGVLPAPRGARHLRSVLGVQSVTYSNMLQCA